VAGAGVGSDVQLCRSAGLLSAVPQELISMQVLVWVELEQALQGVQDQFSVQGSAASFTVMVIVSESVSSPSETVKVMVYVPD